MSLSAENAVVVMMGNVARARECLRSAAEQAAYLEELGEIAPGMADRLQQIAAQLDR